MSKPSAFESCFAQGLDLSEFSEAVSRPSLVKPSNAAKLMVETQKRAQTRLYNENQEHALAVALQERSQTLSGSQRSENFHVPHAALIQMHAQDQKEPRHRLSKGPKTLKRKTNTKKNPPQSTRVSNKSVRRR